MKQKSLGQIASSAYEKSTYCLWDDMVWEDIANAVAKEIRRRDKIKKRKK